MELKLKISPKKYTDESTVISARVPRDMLSDIDKVAAKTGRTRNEIITLSLEFALAHMEIEDNKIEE